MTTQEQLDQVNAAIAAILSGGAQEYKTSNLQVKMPDLQALYNERDRLMWQLANENGTDTTVAVFDRR